GGKAFGQREAEDGRDRGAGGCFEADGLQGDERAARGGGGDAGEGRTRDRRERLRQARRRAGPERGPGGIREPGRQRGGQRLLRRDHPRRGGDAGAGRALDGPHGHPRRGAAPPALDGAGRRARDGRRDPGATRRAFRPAGGAAAPGHPGGARGRQGGEPAGRALRGGDELCRRLRRDRAPALPGAPPHRRRRRPAVQVHAGEGGRIPDGLAGGRRPAEPAPRKTRQVRGRDRLRGGARPAPRAGAPDGHLRRQRPAGHGRLPGAVRGGPARPRRRERCRLRRPAARPPAHAGPYHRPPTRPRDGGAGDQDAAQDHRRGDARKHPRRARDVAGRARVLRPPVV
ncbi:MAG: Transcriptional regulator, LacI family, partial [uncultured Rubrobacteraceae bacterium]